ncbi:MAG TPA: SdrD B-like domain-containing protein [Humisphaera sp.]|nr:SdrD B-like domain-containing protein [Humisphaera sp.]
MKSVKSLSRRRLADAAVIEGLEGRTLFSGLLGLNLVTSPPGPSLGIDGGSASGIPLASGNTEVTVNSPNNLAANLGGSPTLVIPGALVQIDIQVDASGNLVGGNPHGGQDLVVFQDLNGNSTFDAGDTLLLQGTVNAFGSGGLREEFVFTPTDGSWLPYFTVPAGAEQVGVQLDVLPADASILSLDFANGFTGQPKGTLGALPPLQRNGPPVIISGTKYSDLTGLGLSPDDTPLGGVTINLYSDANNSGALDVTDPLVGTTTTSNAAGHVGQYSFSVSAAGTYFVQEVVPAGYIETAPVSSAPYTIVVTATDLTTGNTYGKNDFDNYKIPYIKGNKFEDITGNGFSSDDTALGGVKILLYKDSNKDGVLTAADALYATTTTSAVDGSFSFSKMPVGKYFVTEQLPSSKWLSTGPTNQPKFNGIPYYTVNVTAVSVSTGNRFDNFYEECDITNVSSFYYTINNGTTHYSTLNGHVHEGDQVMVCFNLKTPDTITLVSYTAPSSSFVASKAGEQVIFDKATGTFGPGWHCLTITVPMCFFQIDFICGPAIDHFGPAGSNVFYRAEKRLFDAGQGGTDYCFNGGGAISGYVFNDKNKSGTRNSGDVGIAGVLITLTGTTSSGHNVKLYRLTDANGFYYFKGLRAGTYSIAETQPKGFTDSVDPIGTVNGTNNGKQVANDSISSIVLNLTSVGINYDFAENT